MEHENKGHAVKAYKVWKNPNVSFWHKFKEIAIEIGIIVFAVSLSIWLHGVSENSHQQEEVQEFYNSIKIDLSSDIKTIEQSQSILNKVSENYNQIKDYDNNKLDSIIKNKSEKLVLGEIYRIYNNGNFEGFKSSGKLGFIKDVNLKSQILLYYQSLIPAVIQSENRYNNSVYELKKTFNFKTLNIPEVIQERELKHQLENCMSNAETNSAIYNVSIEMAQRILSKIEHKN